jgi:hypothetical protein
MCNFGFRDLVVAYVEVFEGFGVYLGRQLQGENVGKRTEM